MTERYEYKIEMAESETLQRLLNDEGTQGWRVSAINFRTPPDQTIVLFERTIDE